MDMTGRDLIMYILEHHLEDASVFDNGMFIGFLSATQAAEMCGVGVGTIHAWVATGRIDGIRINEELYVPANFKSTWR